MGSLVILQLPELSKTFVTIRAGIRLFASVSPHVHLQFTQQAKLLWTFLALKGGAALVDFHMLLQGSAPRKGLVAYRACVWVLACVNLHMFLQKKRLRKGLGTLWTVVPRFIAGMNLHMTLQRAILGK
jgi:hypothetical protein